MTRSWPAKINGRGALDEPPRSLKLLIRCTSKRLDIEWYIVLTYLERRKTSKVDSWKSDPIEIRTISFFRIFFRKESLIYQKFGKNLRNTMQLLPQKIFNPNPTFLHFRLRPVRGFYLPRHF